MNEIFQEAGLIITKENKKNIDSAIHGIVGTQYKNCSATWKEVKKRLVEDKESFVNALKNLT